MLCRVSTDDIARQGIGRRADSLDLHVPGSGCQYRGDDGHGSVGTDYRSAVVISRHLTRPDPEACGAVGCSRLQQPGQQRIAVNRGRHIEPVVNRLTVAERAADRTARCERQWLRRHRTNLQIKGGIDQNKVTGSPPGKRIDALHHEFRIAGDHNRVVAGSGRGDGDVT